MGQVFHAHPQRARKRAARTSRDLTIAIHGQSKAFAEATRTMYSGAVNVKPVIAAAAAARALSSPVAAA